MRACFERRSLLMGHTCSELGPVQKHPGDLTLHAKYCYAQLKSWATTGHKFQQLSRHRSHNPEQLHRPSPHAGKPTCTQVSTHADQNLTGHLNVHCCVPWIRSKLADSSIASSEAAQVLPTPAQHQWFTAALGCNRRPGSFTTSYCC